MSNQDVFQWLQNFGRRKNFNSLKSLTTPLNRCLTTTHLVFFAVAQMAGAGVYTMTGTLIRDQTGPAGFISYLMGAISAIFTGVCYAEFASIIPRAGSCYIYTYAMLGELIAFLVGWTTISDSLIGMAAIAKAFSGTVNLLADGQVVNWTEHNVGTITDSSGILDTSPDLIALALIIFLILISVVGTKMSLTFNAVITTIQISCLVIVSAACFGYGSMSNWTGNKGFFPRGFTGVLRGASVVVFAFSGFDSLANASEEAKNPRKSIPLALFISLTIITTVYVLASLGLSYVVPSDHLSYSSPFVGAFVELGQTPFVWIAGIGTLLATGAAKIAHMYVVPRYIYAMASDGLIFKFLAKVDSRTQVPIIALVVGGIISGFLAVLFKIQILTEFISMGILMSYMTIGLNLFVLRYLHWEKISDDANETTSKKSKEPPQLEFRDFIQPFSERLFLLKRRGMFKAVLFTHFISDLFFACIVDYAVVLNSVWAWTLFAFSLLFVLMTFAVLCCYRPLTMTDSFETPLMPLAPALTILVNMILLMKITYLTWIRFLIWSLLGMLIYLFYGVKNSNVDENTVDVPSSGYIPLDDINEELVEKPKPNETTKLE